MSKKNKKKVKQENLFISTQQEAQKPQMLDLSSDKLEFRVEDTFKCPIYIAHKPEWIEPLNKASDPIIKRVRKDWQKKIDDPNDEITTMPNSLHSELLWQYPEFKEIAQLILQQGWNILHWQGYDLTGRIPMLTELWVQEFPKEGGFHDIHEHGNNGSQQIHYKVKPGQFIFFNSYMPHSYVHHKGDEKFRFIHFNMQAATNQKLASNNNDK